MIRDLIIIAAVYLALCPLWSLPLYEKLLFFPTQSIDAKTTDFWLDQIVTKYGASKRDVSITSKAGHSLKGWLFLKPGAKKVVIVSHGNAGNISHRLILANALLACGVSVMLYDYRGYGQNSGAPSLAGICEDGLLAYDLLVDVMRVPPTDIIAYGESIGTGVACTIADNKVVGGVILQSGFPSLMYAAHDRLWFTWLYPEQWFSNLDNLRMMRARHKPLLIIQGGKDMIFPMRYAEVLYKKASAPKELLKIPAMGHTVDDPEDKTFHNGVTRFVDGMDKLSRYGGAQ
jgi:fermentation-respiration switch protein FrsA (DUF1100 family)